MAKFAAKLAISEEDRLQRMRENIKRDIPRLRPQLPRPESLAVVGFGPSLRETWKAIKTPFICTTSGAHDFLIERGLMPTWHVEFEPRPHKAFFLKNPKREVTYCLASVCHPNLFDAVEGYQTLMWHGGGGNMLNDCDVVLEAEGDEAIVVTGGSTAGLRALAVGHVLGFRKFELFGLDCSYTEDAVWAGPHSGVPHTKLKIECNGREFYTSDTMINAAEELFAFFREMPGCHINVHGDNLVAERIRLCQKDANVARDRWWRPLDFEVTDAPMFPGVTEVDSLISEDYRKLNEQLHKNDINYGNSGGKYAQQVRYLQKLLGTDDILDYGCGKCRLEKTLGFSIKNYDPAIPEHSALPEPADIVVCSDVLEHVEQASLSAVLKDLKRVTKRILILDIAVIEALKTLPDGSNVHAIVKEPKWWVGEIGQRFDFLSPPFATGGSLKALCIPKAD